jgi:menaquinone-9 beta-reductase
VDCDIAIVGSGPAGCSTALHLAALGLGLASRTLILERGHHPRHKLCAGGVVPDAEIVLGRLGLDLDELPHADADCVHLRFLGRGLQLKIGRIAFRVVRRDELDAWLAEKVRARGVRLEQGTRVRALKRIRGGLELETDRGPIRARVVVGADGAASIVRRAISEDECGGNVARVVELWTPEIPPDPARALPPREAFIEFGCALRGVQGYWWTFPTQVDGRAMRNWGVYDSRIARDRGRGSLKNVLREALESSGFDFDEYRLDGHPLRWFEADRLPVSPRVLLVGDAMGVDPLFGEGIGPALGYGRIAAEALTDAFERRDFSFASYPSRILHSPLGHSLRRRTWTAKMLYRMRSVHLLRFGWWHCGPLIRSYVRRCLLGWAAREP